MEIQLKSGIIEAEHIEPSSNRAVVIIKDHGRFAYPGILAALDELKAGYNLSRAYEEHEDGDLSKITIACDLRFWNDPKTIAWTRTLTKPTYYTIPVPCPIQTIPENFEAQEESKKICERFKPFISGGLSGIIWHLEKLLIKRRSEIPEDPSFFFDMITLFCNPTKKIAEPYYTGLEKQLQCFGIDVNSEYPYLAELLSCLRTPGNRDMSLEELWKRRFYNNKVRNVQEPKISPLEVALNRFDFSEEQLAIVETAREKLYLNQTQRELGRLQTTLAIIRRMIDLGAIPYDIAEFRRRRTDFAAELIYSTLERHGIVPEKVISNIHAISFINESLPRSERFYDLIALRQKRLAERVSEETKEGEVAVIVVPNLLSKGLFEMLNQRGQTSNYAQAMRWMIIFRYLKQEDLNQKEMRY